MARLIRQAAAPGGAAAALRRGAARTAAVAVVVASAIAPAAHAQAREGGHLTVLLGGDVDSIDPGITYYAGTLPMNTATQRTLFSYLPDAPETPVADLAAAPPVVSADARTVTVTLRAGVRFSPPVNREVTSRDVRYAIERGFFRTVNNPYAELYFGDLVGARPGVAPGTTVPGIETPDDRTLVFRLDRPTGGSVAGALVLMSTAPVPPEYAAPFDARRRSTYGRNLVATGPYMIRNAARGRLVGYRPGRRISLVRNPNWDRATDFRPAHLDRITLQITRDSLVAGRRIVRGSHLIGGDLLAAPPVIREVRRRRPGQIAITEPGSVNYIPLNTKRAPFDDLNVRRAVAASIDRVALRRAFGGPLAGRIATHMIPPGTLGFQEAGGAAGPGLDFLAPRRGDLRLARRYLRAAGYPAGRYTGRRPIRIVTIADPVARGATRSLTTSLRRLGFRLRVRAVTPEAFFSAECPNPARPIHICAAAGWVRDFPDPQTILEPVFRGGENILAQGNNNWAQLDVPAIDAAMDAAGALADPAQRAAAWAQIDRDVSAQAAVVPWVWGRNVLIRSRDVAAVPSEFTGYFDLSFTALR